jgi:hypothetical protein
VFATLWYATKKVLHTKVLQAGLQHIGLVIFFCCMDAFLTVPFFAEKKEPKKAGRKQ